MMYKDVYLVVYDKWYGECYVYVGVSFAEC